MPRLNSFMRVIGLHCANLVAPGVSCEESGFRSCYPAEASLFRPHSADKL